MNRKIILIFLIVCNVGFAQIFEIHNDTITKSNRSNTLHQYRIQGNTVVHDTLLNYTVFLEVLDSSTLNHNEYSFDYKEISLKNLNTKSSYAFYLQLKQDVEEDRDRTIHLKLGLKDSLDKKLESPRDTLKIVVKGITEELSDYSYLAYIGTNFDLVDGVKANKLFFATNIYLEPLKKKNGWYLSLYGNRALSSTDSIQSRITREYQMLNDTLYTYRDKATAVTKTISDNLGAHVSLLLYFTEISNNIKVIFAPSTEFIWRRTSRKLRFVNRIPLDTLSRPATSSVIPLPPPDNDSYNFNEFSWDFGSGVILAHQSKRMSVRLHISAGASSRFKERITYNNTTLDSRFINTWDAFFTGRAWITEASSGITLQAEVTNNFFNSRPYYVVTLSKAINFKNLGDIFSPVVTR
tara:strand:- start:13 stop:1239 length:1227 start_codon:yes stop_codon:yes gene_type:complete